MPRKRSTLSRTKRGRTTKANTSLEALCLADLKPATVRYLAEPYLPLGTVCLLEGDPASGKGYLAAEIGAAVTRGRATELADGAGGACTPANVIYMTAEDAPTTIRDRFVAQGADLSRVFCVPRPISLKETSLYEELLARHHPALLVVDPVQALLADTNMNAANSVRVALQPLVQLAARCEVTILVIRHLSKGSGRRAIHRGLGSIDFSALARSVIRIGEDPQRPGARVLVHVKSSLGAQGPSIEFEITDRLVWLGRSELRAEDLEARPRSARGRSALEVALEFVKREISDGPRSTKEVKAAARRAGITERTLERAAKELGVVHERVGKKGRRGGGEWVWSASPALAALNGEANPRPRKG